MSKVNYRNKVEPKGTYS